MSKEEAQELLKRITFDPEQFGGKPCIRGMRFMVSDILELLASKMTPEDILYEHDILEPEDIRAACLYAARFVSHSVISA